MILRLPEIVAWFSEAKELPEERSAAQEGVTVDRNSGDGRERARKIHRSLPTILIVRRAFALAAMLMTTVPAFAQGSACQIAGNWIGSLDTGAGSLHLVLHIQSEAAGGLTVKLDSPDQNVIGLTGANIAFSNGTLTFAVPSVRGTYKGTVSAGCDSISGTWTQGSSLPLTFNREEANTKPSPVDGYWLGTLNTPGGSLRIGVQIKTLAPGKLDASLDSLDQGAHGIPAADVKFSENVLSFTVPAVHGSYSATLSADGKMLKGTFTQGQPLPLDLARQQSAPAAPAPPKMLPAQPPVALANVKQVLDQELAPVLSSGVLAKSTAGGLVIGVIDHGQRRIFAYGTARPDSIFDIGSVTKSFTALLLAQLVEQKKITLDEPVRELLPPGTVAKPQGPEIRLVDLVTQHSGLPRMPDNFTPADPNNPYADYDGTKLSAFISKHGVALPTDAKFLYSNVGFGLLGFALARRAGVSYGDLVQSEITGPLGMKDTVIALSPEQQKRFIQGHTPSNAPAHAWDLTALAGAGALRSDANDLLTLVEAELHPDHLKSSGKNSSNDTTLPAAIAMTHILRADVSPQMKVGMGWLYTEETHMYWHDGGTGGYTSFVFFQPDDDRGVVVLYNRDDIGASTLPFTDRVAAFVGARLSGKPAMSLSE